MEFIVSAVKSAAIFSKRRRDSCLRFTTFFRFPVSFQDSVFVTLQQSRARRKSSPASPGSPTLDLEMKLQSGLRSLNGKLPQALSPPTRGPLNGTPRPAVRPPTRCLSPVRAFSKMQNRRSPDQSRRVTSAVRANGGGSFSQALRQEVGLNDPQVRLSDTHLQSECKLPRNLNTHLFTKMSKHHTFCIGFGEQTRG